MHVNNGISWHSMTQEQALQALHSDADRGLDDSEARHRLSQHGANTLPEASRRSLLMILLRQFRSPLIYILFIAAIFAFALKHYGDAAVILAVVFVNAVIGAFQEGRAERSMAALRRLSVLEVRVLRGGSEKQLPASKLVPGDILLLNAGDAVAADARLLQSKSMQAAEAALTGESTPVAKQVIPLDEQTLLADRSNMLYSGTHVTAGRGRALVVATGVNTAVGDIARLTETAEAPQTPLELRIAQFGRYLVAAAVALFVAVMSFGLLRNIPVVDIFMVAISQMVSMVPEGLPVAMTIALAVGMQRMAARGAIVRRLAAVETLGSTSVICSDKTGTLTRNEMTAIRLWMPDGRVLDVSGSGYAPEGTISHQASAIEMSAEPGLARLLQAAALCNDARLLPPTAEEARWRALGDPTEAALLTLAHKGRDDLQSILDNHDRHAEIPFDSDVQMMATQHRHTDGSQHVFIKGAPEAVMAICSHWRDRVQRQAMDDDKRAQVSTAAANLAGDSLRVLALAEVDNGTIDDSAGFSQFAERTTLLGLVGQMDPPREEVKLAIEECQHAGIRPIMVTGDHKQTGLAIARQLGIAAPADRAIDGRELEQMPEQDLRAGLPHIAVFARVHPAQKLRIVEALQWRGDVVAMTGDGVNDAPALARADVGVAMGISGTEVAKSAADIVITDDNFATIVNAVEEGRLVYRNLKKVILYLVATSMAEITVLLGALLLGYPLPLAAVQILWINIVTEGTVTINLIMEPPEGDEMQQKPVSLAEPLLNAPLLRRVALMTPTMAFSTLGYFIWQLQSGVAYAQVQTETFTVLAACQWFNVLNCQSATRSALRLGLFRNKWLVGGLAVGILLQLIVIYWPPMNMLFHTVPLAMGDIGIIIAFASLVLWVEEARKLLARWRAHRSQ
jgi:Ca2+-transporting ATPase